MILMFQGLTALVEPASQSLKARQLELPGFFASAALALALSLWRDSLNAAVNDSLDVLGPKSYGPPDFDPQEPYPAQKSWVL